MALKHEVNISSFSRVTFKNDLYYFNFPKTEQKKEPEPVCVVPKRKTQKYRGRPGAKHAPVAEDEKKEDKQVVIELSNSEVGDMLKGFSKKK